MAANGCSRDRESYVEMVLSSDVSLTKPVRVLHRDTVNQTTKALIQTMVSYFWQI